jgi:RHS repeat-associated protein
VRAVIQENPNLFSILLSYADYYAFGEQLPSRNTTSDYRYAFQGQELDKETGMEAFQLRLWDGRIGRWLSPDPYGQYDSPYIGMGNNPVSMVDPDGGFAEGPGDPKPSLWQQFKNFLSGGSAIQLDEVVVQGRGRSSSSNWFSDIFDFNPFNTQATENRNFFFNWWGSETTQNFVKGSKQIYEAQGYIPGVDAFQSAAFEKNYAKAGAQLGANFIPVGKIFKGAPILKKASGSYLLEFESGLFYAGKGLEPRMLKSIHRIETTFGDKLLNKTFYPAGTVNEAFIMEHKLMMQFGGPKSFDRLSPTYN